MDRRNRLYYAAAAGTVLVFLFALIGLTTCGNGNSKVSAPAEQAVLSAYQQGYLDGYSKGYSEGFAAGIKSGTAGQASATSTISRGCAVSSASTDDIDSNADVAG